VVEKRNGVRTGDKKIGRDKLEKRKGNLQFHTVIPCR